MLVQVFPSPSLVGVIPVTHINFPLGREYPDELFVRLYSEVVAPMLREFAPEMIFVSAGFDGHILDPMEGFRIHTETFGVLAEVLIAEAEQSAQGRILFCLEGGYNPVALADSVRETTLKLVQCPRVRFDPQFKIPTLFSEELDLFRRFHRQFFPGVL